MGSWGFHRSTGIYICSPSSEFWVYGVVSHELQYSSKESVQLASKSDTQTTSVGSFQREGSTRNPLQMFELLTLSRRLSTATVRRKLMPAACIHDLIPSVTTHPKLMARWGLEHRLTGKLGVLFFSLVSPWPHQSSSTPTLLLMLHQTACPSHAPFSHPWWTRSWEILCSVQELLKALLPLLSHNPSGSAVLLPGWSLVVT